MAEFSPGFDPEISLAVQTPSVAQQSPLATIGAFAQVRNELNQNALFQQQQAARFRAGQIMATAPSAEQGAQALMSDPQVAGFLPDYVAQYQSALATEAGRQQTEQAMGQSGLTNALQLESASAQNPSSFNPIANAELGLITNPTARATVGEGLARVKMAIADEPERAPQMVASLAAASGLPAGQIYAMLGEVPPSISMEPMGPGGSLVPVQSGSALGQPSGATIVGQQGGPASLGGASPPPASGTPGSVVQGDFAALGMPPEGTAPSNPPLTGLTPLEQSQQLSMGKNAGEIEQNMNDLATQLPQANYRINAMYQTLTHFLAGGGMDTMGNLAKALQAVRDRVPGMDKILPDSTINKISGGSIGDEELFRGTVVPTLMNMLQVANPKVFAEESGKYLNAFNENTDPRAILAELNLMRQATQAQAYQLRGWQDFNSRIGRGDPSVAGLSRDDFPTWFYSTHYDPGTGLPTDASAFPQFDSGPVLGIPEGQNAAGEAGGPNPAESTPRAAKGQRKSLKEIFGG